MGKCVGEYSEAPETCGKLVAAGMRVVVEPRAGVESEYTDDTYTRAGCNTKP